MDVDVGHPGLAWLNSRVGLESTITRPYTGVTVSTAANKFAELGCLGRRVSLSALGLPAGIESNGIQLLNRASPPASYLDYA